MSSAVVSGHREPRVGAMTAGPAKRLPKVVGILIFTWLFVWPLVMLVYGAFRTAPVGANQAWSLAGVERALTDPDTWSTLLTSLIYSITISFLGMVFAIFFATVTTRFDVPLRRWVTPTMVMLVAMPTALYALAWAMLGAGGTGLIPEFFSTIGLGALAPLFETRSWFGLIIVTVFKAGALAYLMVVSAFRNRNAALEEAARTSGASGTRAFFGVELPALAPALIASTLYVFVKGLEAFETPAMLGLPAGIDVFSTHIYSYLRGGLTADYSAASAASLIIVAILAVLILVQWKLTGGGKSYSLVGGRSTTGTLRPAGKAKWPIVAAIVLFVGVAFVLPIVQVLLSSLQPFLGSPELSFDNFARLLGDSRIIQALQTTLIVSALGGAFTVALGLTVAYAFVRLRTPLGRYIQLASWIPAAMPGLVLGLAFLWSFLTTPGGTTFYGTIWLLVLGLAVATVPLATRTVEGPLVQVGVEMEEAARISGADFLRSVAHVTMRILTPSLISAWFLVAITISGILDVPILLGSTDTQMIAPLSFSYYNNGESFMASALYVLYTLAMAALALVLLLVGAVGRRVIRAKHKNPLDPTTSSTAVSVRPSRKEQVR